jgi:hypothetical protein
MMSKLCQKWNIEACSRPEVPGCVSDNCRTYFCDPSLGLVVCFRPPSVAFMLGVIFVAGLPAPLGCALKEVPEAGFAFEAILLVEAIAELSVKIRAVARWHKKK